MATFPEIDSRGLALALRAGQVREPTLAARMLEGAERLLAFGLLILVAPILAAAALIVTGLSRRCPFIAHARVGKNGEEIWVLKLRTMWGHAARRRGPWLLERLKGEPVPDIKRQSDPRVASRFAAACRRYSIDELPQLWHVARGQFSLVGPRPMTREELELHYGPAAVEVLRVKPGLTGLWQIRGRSLLNYRQRRRLDLFLVRHWSPRLYLGILLATVPKVLSGRNAW